MNSKDDDEIEDVGYCRPPVRTRFKKGQSGNPHGRPHRRVKVPSLDEILMEKVKVKVGGKTVEMTQLELVERSIIGNIQKGDAKAIRYLLDLRKLIPAASYQPPSPEDALEKLNKILQGVGDRFKRE